MTSENNYSQYSPLCTFPFQPLIISGCLGMRKSWQFSRKALIGMHPNSTNLLCWFSSQQKPSAQALWGTASTSCEFLSQQTSLCSAYSSCHQTPIFLKSGDLWWKWSLWYLCQLTTLQLLLFPIQESLVTSDHSADHFYTPPLMATLGNTLPLPSYDPYNAVFSIHVLYWYHCHCMAGSLLWQQKSKESKDFLPETL